MTNAEHDMIEQQATHYKTYEIDQKETSKLSWKIPTFWVLQPVYVWCKSTSWLIATTIVGLFDSIFPVPSGLSTTQWTALIGAKRIISNFNENFKLENSDLGVFIQQICWNIQSHGMPEALEGKHHTQKCHGFFPNGWKYPLNLASSNCSFWCLILATRESGKNPQCLTNGLAAWLVARIETPHIIYILRLAKCCNAYM